MLNLQCRLINGLARGQNGRESSTTSFQQIADWKWQHLKKYSRLYDSSNKFEHQDKLYQQFVYGNSCHLSGMTPYNFSSLKLTKTLISCLNPKLLILGGLSDNYLRYYQWVLSIRRFYEHPIMKPDKMQCKQRLTRLIQTRLQNDDDLMWIQDKKQMLEINHIDKRIVPLDYLTAGYIASQEEDVRIVLGKPSDALAIEDIIMRYELKELKAIAQRAIYKAKQRNNNSTQWRFTYTREAIQNYVMTQEPQIFSRQLTYQAALLRRYAKLYDKILLLLPGYNLERVASQVHQIDLKPQAVYRNGLQDVNSESYSLLQKTLKADPQQILEKYALIVMMRQSWSEKQFARGDNIFRHMCFGTIFQNMSIQQLHDRYAKARQATQSKWYKLMQHRVNNVHVLPGPHIKLTLEQQFQVLEERAHKNFPYAFQEKNYLSEYEDRVKMAKLEQKMRDYLNQEGDQHRIHVFQRFTKGQRSKQGIILYSKLLGKMNVELEERLKLPVFHYGAFRGIYKEYLRDFLLKGQENSKLQQKIQKRLTKTQQLMENHMKKLDNPDELRKYVAGQKGKTFQIGFNIEDGPQFDPEDLQALSKMYGQMSPEDEAQMRQQYGEDWNKIE